MIEECKTRNESENVLKHIDEIHLLLRAHTTSRTSSDTIEVLLRKLICLCICILIVSMLTFIVHFPTPSCEETRLVYVTVPVYRWLLFSSLSLYSYQNLLYYNGSRLYANAISNTAVFKLELVLWYPLAADRACFSRTWFAYLKKSNYQGRLPPITWNRLLHCQSSLRNAFKSRSDSS